jgi:putative peptide zinc metalloprotease protein
VVPLLVFELVTVLIHLPRLLATAGSSADKLWHDTGKAFGAGKIFNGVSDVMQLVVLAIPILGIVLMVWRVAKGATVWAWTHTRGRPVRRGLSAVVGAVVVALLALAWIPRHNYRQIQPHERGTVGEGIVAIRYLPQHPTQLDKQATASDLSAASTTTTTAPLGAASPATTTTVATGSGGPGTTTPVTPTVTRLPATTTTVAPVATTAPPTTAPAAPPGT